MEPRVKYVGFFDPESVCVGDILQSKENKNVLYVVLLINIEGEEWYCTRVGEHGRLPELMKWIGFEHIDDFSKGEFELI
jgi:hypothetical protein